MADAPQSVGSPLDPARARILHGPLALTVLRVGAPLATAMALQVLFNLVDQYLIARLPAAVANPSLDALGICDMVAALGTIVSYGVSTATVALVSAHKGRGDMEAAARVAWGSVGLVLVLGVVFGLVGAMGSHWIVQDVMGAKGDVGILATRYLRVIMGGNVTIFLLFQLTAIQRALGHARGPMAVLVAGNALNLVLAVLLVYGPAQAPAVFAWGPHLAAALGTPRMEVVGAAWATVIARALACIVPAVLVARELSVRVRRLSIIPDGATARAVLAMAWPASAQFVVRVSAVLVVIALVHHAYTTTANSEVGTAYALCLRLETMALFVSMGWGGAAQSFVGMCLGAGDGARALRAGWITAGYTMVTMAVLALVYVTLGRTLLEVFTASAPILDIAQGYLGVVGPSYVALGMAVVLANAMAGAGSTRLTLRLDAMMVLLVQIPAMLLAVTVGGARPGGLWAILVGVNVLTAGVYAWVYRTASRWQPKAPPAGGTLGGAA